MPEARHCHWLGFGSLNDFLGGVSATVLKRLADAPVVYLSPLAESASTVKGSSLVSSMQYVIVQSILPGNIVAYAKMATGHLLTNCGKALDPLAAHKVNLRTDSLVEAIEKLCQLQDYRIVRGTLAMPGDHRYLTADTDPAIYDADLDLYFLPTKVPVEVPGQ